MISNEGKKVIIYSGTTEGRTLAKELVKAGVSVVVCVATEYGKKVMDSMPGVEIRIGRKDEKAIYQEIMEKDIEAVIDATHPFAKEVTENIKTAATRAGKEYIRFMRDTEIEKDDNINYFPSISDSANYLKNTDGNILLTIGSKELSTFLKSGIEKERLYVRVLPSVESITVCQENNIEGKHIIALQGPFSKELNAALMEQYDIKHMLTKESGANGVYIEKLYEAQEMGFEICVVTNPEKYNPNACKTVREVMDTLSSLLNTDIKTEYRAEVNFSLVGLGMGNRGSMTGDAVEVISSADYLFGAERLIEAVEDIAKNVIEKKPYYLAGDILPCIENIICGMKEAETINVVILFSGDTGFYSGATGLYKALVEKGYSNVKIISGISSISALAAKSFISWENARIKSIHGTDKGEWENSVRKLLYDREAEKIYLLLSGREQLIYLLEYAEKTGFKGQFYIGYQLSYAEEKIYTGSACDILSKYRDDFEQGLYSMFITKDKKNIGLFISDEEFARDKAPMTKEEIRHISVAKLNLQQDSVLYDIGCGTGSIACEAAGLYSQAYVYGIECNPIAIKLSKENVSKLGLNNVQIVEGMAPDAFEGLPMATHAFIGGSKGRLYDILEALFKINPKMKIVINAVSMETMAELSQIEEKFNVVNMNTVLIQVSNVKKLGLYHMMQGGNPVYICSFELDGRP